ncbi:MAG: DUF1127 domain-containing protein [Pseudomonadota bacterium]
MRAIPILLPRLQHILCHTQGWTRVMGHAVARRRGRKALVHLDDHLLRDIGLTRRAAADEAGKPFWLD